MFSIKASQQNTQQKTWRERVFPFVAGIPALALFVVAGIEFVTAWIMREPGEVPHLWHIAELVALGLLLAFPMLLLARHPQAKPILAQFLILSSFIATIALVPFKPEAGAIGLIGIVTIIVYPHREALWDVTREGPVSLILLGLSLVMAFCLAPIAQREIFWQITAGSSDIHAQLLHWIGSALLMILLVLAGVMASTKRPGWQTLSYIVGSVYLYLGMTAIIVPEYAGSWGVLGGTLAFCAGGIYIAFTIAETANMRRKARELKQQNEEGQYVWVRSQYESSSPAQPQTRQNQYSTPELVGKQ